MSNYRYDHTHVYCRDAEESSRFYVDMFNAAITGRDESDGFARVAINLDGHDILFKSPSEKPSVPSPRLSTWPEYGHTYGIDHIGVVTDDLDAAVADLRAKGAEFVQEITNFRPGIRISFVKGPDDTVIELLERKPVT